LISSVLVSGTLIAQLFKRFTPRDRPSQLSWSIPQEAWRHGSFPSGHTITSFAVAFYITLVTWRTPRWYVGPISIALAMMVGLSRIYRGVHWPTDVMAGACGGLVTACILYLVLNARSTQSPA
jgi:undecaprenyl-diphosphatase